MIDPRDTLARLTAENARLREQILSLLEMDDLMSWRQDELKLALARADAAEAAVATLQQWLASQEEPR